MSYCKECKTLCNECMELRSQFMELHGQHTAARIVTRQLKEQFAKIRKHAQDVQAVNKRLTQELVQTRMAFMGMSQVPDKSAYLALLGEKLRLQTELAEFKKAQA